MLQSRLSANALLRLQALGLLGPPGGASAVQAAPDFVQRWVPASWRGTPRLEGTPRTCAAGCTASRLDGQRGGAPCGRQRRPAASLCQMPGMPRNAPHAALALLPHPPRAQATTSGSRYSWIEATHSWHPTRASHTLRRGVWSAWCGVVCCGMTWHEAVALVLRRGMELAPWFCAATVLLPAAAAM